MPTCPNGHRNPRNQQLCRECDALIIPAKKRRLSDRALWIIVSTGVVAAVVLATVLGVVATHRTEPVTSSAPTTAGSVAMQQWWSAAREHFDELQGALDASRGALERHDQPALEKSCQQMHDAGVVKLRAHLPAPDPDLTAELDAAINDAHDAAHMCLAAISGSLNNYFGEFAANLDQAEMHLKAALSLVNKSLLTA
jgi:flagellar hook-basal body complex protein FliE